MERVQIVAAIGMALLLSACAFETQTALDEIEGYRLYRLGHYQDALKIWREAATAGDAGSAYRLAEEYLDAKVIPRDVEVAVRLLNQSADGGDSRALMELGFLYDQGKLVRKDIDLAAQYYIRAAQAGQPAAQYNAGVLYEEGEGVEQDLVRAYMYYMLADSAGFFPFAPTALQRLATRITPEQKEAAEALAARFGSE